MKKKLNFSGDVLVLGLGDISSLEPVLVVPGHPIGWVSGWLVGVLLQLRQIVEGIDAVEFTGVDQAHKQIAYAGAVLGLKEIGVFSMENCFL